MNSLEQYNYLWGINSVSLEKFQGYLLLVLYVFLFLLLLKKKSHTLKICCITLIGLISIYSYYIIFKRVKADVQVCKQIKREKISEFFHPDIRFLLELKKRIGKNTSIKFEIKKKFSATRIDAICFHLFPISVNFWDNNIVTDHLLIIVKNELQYFYKNTLQIRSNDFRSLK